MIIKKQTRKVRGFSITYPHISEGKCFVKVRIKWWFFWYIRLLCWTVFIAAYLRIKKPDTAMDWALQKVEGVFR